jgi:ribose transport system ATP-binding protein
MRAIIAPYLAKLGLDVSPDTPVAALSIAQQQLVEIAKALSLRARVLVMDEPTSSLTPAETTRLHRVMADLRQQGVAIVYITHRLGEVPVIADRAVVMRDGANVGMLAHEALTRDEMIRLMVGRDLAGHAPSSGGPSGQVRLLVQDLRTRRYPKHAVSFTVDAGEILGVSGLVGAGRSEMAEAIFGVVPPLSGRVEVDGSPIACASPSDAIAHGVFLVPEDRRSAGLVVSSSVSENVSLPGLWRYARLGLISRVRETAAVEATCRPLQVKAVSLGAMVATLSGGNQQKIVLAKWLALGPKVLIVDEPTRGIDVGAKAEIYRLLRALAHDGVSIVMISSDMEEVLQLSDRVAVMREGRLTGIMPREACTESGIMALAVGEQMPRERAFS